MNLTRKNALRKITIIGLICLIVTATLPMEVKAVSNAKNAKKYKITIHNASSNTVIKKGKKLKIRSTAIAKDGTKGKVRYKSSNKSVISVSKKGVIKGKKKGKAKITAYVKSKGKIRSRKTITVRVGTPVSTIKLSGHNYVRAGRTSKLKAKVLSKKATNKKVLWKSSNPNVAIVNSKGVVTGKGNGQTTITATAADGSGVSRSITVFSHKYTKDETHWIAHRGLHENEIENTAAAFEAAGKAGFWGCECDIYETRHDEDGNFEIVIDHDGNFNRVFGVNKSPSDLTATDIRMDERLRKVCFFDDYLNICKQYEMVPIIEIKYLSDQGLEMMIDIMQNNNLLAKNKAQFISFNPTMIEKAREFARNKYDEEIYTGYLTDGENATNLIEYAKDRGFDGINIYYKAMNDSINNACKTAGLRIGTWTYADASGAYKYLYEHVVLQKYSIDTVTTDGAMFK